MSNWTNMPATSGPSLVLLGLLWVYLPILTASAPTDDQVNARGHFATGIRPAILSAFCGTGKGRQYRRLLAPMRRLVRVRQ
ncbi:MAG: hypothetical protein WED11_05625 [Natronospirillum sp.]